MNHCQTCYGYYGDCREHSACVPCNCKHIPTGWKCPVCNSVMSPTTSSCVTCTPQIKLQHMVW